MWIRHLGLSHFRNYDSAQLAFSPQKNLIIGENAAGKSNILEAIYFLSHGKSLRARADKELMQWDSQSTGVLLDVYETEQDRFKLEVRMAQTPEGSVKTVFKLDGNVIRARSEMVGKIPTVTFFLPDLLMLRGAPDDRRQALDRGLVQYDPVHYKRLRAYQRVREQKSHYLRQTRGYSDPQLLESLNEQLAEAGASVMAARVQYLMQLEPFAALSCLEMTAQKEELTIRYQPSFEGEFQADEHSLRLLLLQKMRENASEELRRAQVLIGPHRDDVRFYLAGRDASLYGSQGQQRSIVLALKLSEMKLLTQKHNDIPPILLLDDVMAELDPHRQHALLHHLDPRMQLILTTTHLTPEVENFLKESTASRVFEVSGGNIKAEQTAILEPV